MDVRVNCSLSFNPELGLHAFIDTVAYRMDVDPSEFKDDAKVALTRLFAEGHTAATAETEVRKILSRGTGTK